MFVMLYMLILSSHALKLTPLRISTITVYMPFLHMLQLIYPITVASKAAGRQRQDAAAAVLFELRKRNARLVEEAALVSIEMVKVAVTQAELWHEGLEEASRLCFGDGDMDAMLNRLQVCAHTIHTIHTQPLLF
jgi:FKBP12-rapamycin binding domain